MKTIGVLGGLGPQATMDFEARVHAVSQRLIPQLANSGYPPMVVYYHRHPPFLVDETLHPIFPLTPDPHLAAALGKLGKMVDFLVCSSNAPHMIRDAIEQMAGCPMLSIIDQTLEEIRKRGWQHVGVLGLGEPKVYKVPLEQLDLICETLPDEPGGLRDKLDDAILRLMAGQTTLQDKTRAVEAVNLLRARSVDGVILGCTEIPLLLGNEAEGDDLVNPSRLLAEAAVRFAME
ncbi:MAG: aspartate/glutamate racemase family protein [Chloroflexota bacterium]